MKFFNRSLGCMSLKWLSLMGFGLSLASCSLGPVPAPPVAQYFLQAQPTTTQAMSSHPKVILLSAIQSAPGYQTNAMLYVMTPYQLESFTMHAWVSPPAQLWRPLLESALQQSGVGMIVHAPISVQADYSIHVHLNRFEQNFQKPQSVFLMQASVVLQKVKTGQVMSEKTFSVSVPAQANTPYAGVLAANIAVETMDEEIAGYLRKRLA